jgi:hypothetical protein
MQCDKYFAHIDIDQIRGEYKDVLRDDVKGLDDLLIKFPNQTTDIIADLNSVPNQAFGFKNSTSRVSTSVFASIFTSIV